MVRFETVSGSLRRVALGIVLLAYVLGGAVRLFHGLETPAPWVEHEGAKGPIVEASCDDDDCGKSSHHHHSPHGHDERVCTSCSASFLIDPDAAVVAASHTWLVDHSAFASSEDPELALRGSLGARGPPSRSV